MRRNAAVILVLLVTLTAMVYGQDSAQEEWIKNREQGMALLQEGNLEQARIFFNRVLELKPEDEMSHYLLACIYVFENYTKTEHMVPMRDGVKLHTQVYSPKDTSQQYPVVYCRSLYSCFAYGTDFSGYFGYLGPGPEFITENYIFVVQDVRGKFLSEGDFVLMKPNTADWNDRRQTDESTDAWDTIDWVIENVTNNNGKVGIWGGSYLAYYGALALVNAHPALKAVSLESPVAEVFKGDDYHHNGALQLAFTTYWLNRNGRERTGNPSTKRSAKIYEEQYEDMYEFFRELGPIKNIEEALMKGQSSFWTDCMQHESRDSFWSERALGQYLQNISGPAVVISGSWFDDQDLYGTLYTYRSLRDQNPGLSLWLIMGCWDHDPWWMQEKGEWGDVNLLAGETGDFYRDQYLVDFFRYYLKSEGQFEQPPVKVFESGSIAMREYESWPPGVVVESEYFLAADGELAEESLTQEGYYEFVSDPKNPVPFFEGKLKHWVPEFMFADQRFVSDRKDVLTFSSTQLEDDLTISGPIQVELYVSTSSTDADWVVKVIDQFPDTDPGNPGYQMMVRGEIIRGKFRESLANPIPFKPGEITRIKYTLPDVNHTFLKGHKVALQIQSSWFPLFDMNPQVFTDIREARAEDFVSAKHRVYYSGDHPSGISFPKLKKE